MLSDETHTITAEVTDSGGNTSSDSITVTVGGGTSDINLSVTKQTAGPNKFADLDWSGATTSLVDIYRNNEPIDTTENDGSYRDKLGKVTGIFTYQVCEAGSITNCSNEASVSW